MYIDYTFNVIKYAANIKGTCKQRKREDLYIYIHTHIYIYTNI